MEPDQNIKKQTYRISTTVPGKRLPGKKELERKKAYLLAELETNRLQLLEWLTPAMLEAVRGGE
jgi:hypothetical protein